MDVSIIEASYDTGHRGVRMGAGPKCFLENGIVDKLQALGHQVSVDSVDPHPDFPTEVATSFAIMRGVGDKVSRAVDRGAFPLVLAGNCNTSVGTISGLAPAAVGVVWFDAHADFNTPETTSTGFVDGMGLAIATGHCWQELARSIPGYEPIPEDHVILMGARDFDPLEWDRLRMSTITRFSDRDINSDEVEQHLGSALEWLASAVDGIYLHLDLDVHDANVAPANHFRPSGGVTPSRLRDVIAFIADRAPVIAAYIGSYDPEVDPNDTTLDSGLAVVETVLSANETG